MTIQSAISNNIECCSLTLTWTGAIGMAIPVGAAIWTGLNNGAHNIPTPLVTSGLGFALTMGIGMAGGLITTFQKNASLTDQKTFIKKASSVATLTSAIAINVMVTNGLNETTLQDAVHNIKTPKSENSLTSFEPQKSAPLQKLQVLTAK